MIRWLDDNLVGRILAGTAAVLLVIALLQGVIWSLPPVGSNGDGEGAEVPRLDIPELQASEPLERFAVVTERPVFSETRQPELVAEDGEEDLEALDEETVDAPEVELAGIVITPSLRMATLRAKDQEESLVAFEGQPLRGDYGSWHVSRIRARNITLASGDGEEMQLNLEVHDRQIAPPPKPKGKPSEAATAQQAANRAQEGEEPLTRAEEIRRRIEERREELRRAAEENEGGQAKTTDYRKAIQNMIANRRKDTRQDQDKED